MSTVKALRFPIATEWRGGRMVDVSRPGKRELRVVTPPEFRNGIPDQWSPEDLLVAAVSSCYVLTLTAIADRLRTPIDTVRVEAAGHLEKNRRGDYRFTSIDLEVEIAAPAGSAGAAERAAALAEKHCIVHEALDVPVHVHVDVRAAVAA